MNRLLILFFLALSACRTKAAEQYGYLALLGNDTVSIERDTRRGNEIVSDEVDRFPRVRRRHATIHLADDGTIEHLEMDITTPSEPSNERDRHVTADVRNDSVRITKHDSTGTKKYAFATGGALTAARNEAFAEMLQAYDAAKATPYPPVAHAFADVLDLGDPRREAF